MKCGWQTKTLGDIAEVIAGQSPEGSFYNTAGDGLPFYQGKKEFGEKFIGEPTIWTSQITKVALEGDVLMSVRAPVGPVNFATEKSCIGRGLAAIRSGSSLDRSFLFNFLLSKQDEINGNEGAVFASISKTDIQKIEIPVPPLPEQQRIVGILDQAFDGIATAKANAEKNLQNARALFESYLQSVFIQRCKSCVKKSLGDLCQVIGGGTPSKDKADYYSGDIFWATVRDMRSEVITETECKITKAAVKASATNVIPSGNVVIATRVGLGKICILGQDTAINQDLRGIVPLDVKVLSVRFLFWWLKSIADKIVAEGTGATVQGVKLPFVKSLLIPLPSRREQQGIIEQLDSLRDETQSLESIYKQKLAALEALKKSLLHQAFTGEL